MLQDFVCELEAQIGQSAQELWRTLDLAKLEEELSERMQRLYAGVVGQVLTELLSEPSYRSHGSLKLRAGFRKC
jgi:hypothetical protein